MSGSNLAGLNLRQAIAFKASALFCQVLGAIGQQVPAAESVVGASTGELSQGQSVQPQLL